MKTQRLFVFVLFATIVACGETPAPAGSSSGTVDASGSDSAGAAETATAADSATGDSAARAPDTGGDTAVAPETQGETALDAGEEVAADAAAEASPADTVGEVAAPEVTTEVAAPDVPPDTTTDTTTALDAEFDAAAEVASDAQATDTTVEGSPEVAAADAGPADTVAETEAPDVAAEIAVPDTTGPSCTPTSPATESCDGIDNDCNGVTDEKGCDDGNPCTNDTCSGAAGCQAAPNTLPCNDNSACTSGDVCAASKCGGTAVNCDDANACTDDSCDPKTGCKHAANTGPCDDSQPCTTEACAASTCKATAKACKDSDACTNDSCDAATGDCAFTVIANCKACTTNGECDDKDACTTDACTASKCANTKIAGCLPPPDFELTDVKFSPANVLFPPVGPSYQPMSLNVQLANLSGKSPGNAAVGTLTVVLNSAASNQGPDVTVVHTASLAKPYLDFAAPTTKIVTASLSGNWSTLKAPLSKYTHLCATMAMAGEVATANNTTCAPIAVHTQQLSMTGVTLSDGSPLANAKVQNEKPLSLKVSYKNSDPLSGGVGLVHIYRSVDDKLDASDAVIAKPAVTAPLPMAADTTVTATVTTPTGLNGPAWLCFKVVPAAFGQPENWDTNPADNVLCVPVSVFDLPDLAPKTIVTPGGVPTVLWASITGNMFPFGKPLNCSVIVDNKMPTTGLTGPTSDVPVTCALLPAGVQDFSKALWQTTWKSPPIAANSVGQTWTAPPGPVLDHTMGVSAGTFKATTPYSVVPGMYQICVAIDLAGTVAEVSETNNLLCAPLQTVAPNLTVTEASLGTAGQELVAGTAYTFLYKGSNNGTCTTGVAFGTRALLSKDDKPSADDTEIWKYDSNPAISANAAFALTVQSGLSKATVPAGFAKGPAFLIVEVDGLGKVYESNEGDNAKAVAVMVK